MKTFDALGPTLQRHVPHDGTFDTPFDGLQIFRVSSPMERLPGVYSPSACFVVQGAKHTYFDADVHRYDSSNYLCTTMPLPVEAEIREASPEHPVLGVLLSLESRVAVEMMVRLRAALPYAASATEETAGLILAPWRDSVFTALSSLLELLDDEVAAPLLGPGRLQELLYAVLTGPGGAHLQATLGGGTQQLGGVLNFISTHLAEPLSMAELAQQAGMSRAAFDRHFRGATSLSPLKYVKTLRLNSAAMAIATGADVSGAARSVGYISSSQFSREFKQHFGSSPRVWATSHQGVIDAQAVA